MDSIFHTYYKRPNGQVVSFEGDDLFAVQSGGMWIGAQLLSADDVVLLALERESGQLTEVTL